MNHLCVMVPGIRSTVITSVLIILPTSREVIHVIWPFIEIPVFLLERHLILRAYWFPTISVVTLDISFIHPSVYIL